TQACLTPVPNSLQLPFGTYAVTSSPEISTDKELVGTHDPTGGATLCTLKLSVFAFEFVKLRTFGSDAEIVALPIGINHALYSPPLLGVAEKGASCTGVAPFAVLNVPLAWGHGPVAPETLPPVTFSCRHTALSVERSAKPLGLVT